MLIKIAILLAVLATVASGSQGQQPTKNPCQACRSIMSFATKFNSTQNRSEFKNLFESFCKIYYPASGDVLANPCPLLVESLFYVMDNTDPINQCDITGVCGPMELMSDSVAQPVGERGGPFCQTCINIIDEVKGALSDPKRVERVEEKLDDFCEYMKVVKADQECKKVLRDNLEAIIEVIKNQDSGALCDSIKLCTPKRLEIRKPMRHLPSLADFNNFGLETSVSIGPKRESNIAKSFKMSPSCTVCKILVREVSKVIRANRTEQHIRLELLQGCKLIFRKGPERERCDEMVNAYMKELIELITDEADPEMVCVMLSQCCPGNAGNTEERKSLDSVINFGQFLSRLEPESSSLKSCVECKLFIKYLKSSFQDPKSQDYLEGWLLDNLCANIHDENEEKTCSDMIHKYIKLFFNSVAEEMDPETTCQEVGACRQRDFLSLLTIDNARPSVRRQSATFESSEPAKKTLPSEAQACDQCIEVIGKIDDYLSKHKIQDIEQIVDKVCGGIENPNMRSMCGAIVTTIGQDLINSIDHMESPRKVCNELRIC